MYCLHFFFFEYNEYFFYYYYILENVMVGLLKDPLDALTKSPLRPCVEISGKIHSTTGAFPLCQGTDQRQNHLRRRPNSHLLLFLQRNLERTKENPTKYPPSANSPFTEKQNAETTCQPQTQRHQMIRAKREPHTQKLCKQRHQLIRSQRESPKLCNS